MQYETSIKFASIIISFIFLTSCDILDSNSRKITPLDSRINFKVVQSFDNYESVSTPQIFIEMQTEKIYGCVNYNIITDHKVKNKSIIIDITGIDKSGICLTALGPATERIKLGAISGIFELEINNNNFSNKYNLLISDSLIVVDGNETPNTKPLIKYLWSYPKNSFVFLCGTTLSHTSLCDKFIDTLKSVIELQEFSFSEFAEIPYPKSSQGSHYNADARYFYYKSEEDFDKITDVMRSFKKSYFFDEGGDGLWIISWINKNIRSWLL